MKIWIPLLGIILLTGCAGRHPEGTARYDNFDSVKVEQMVGNNVNFSAFSKTVVCLNARRETRLVTAVTNTVFTSVTNPVITAITNLTITTSTNLLYTSMTNLEPAQSTLPTPVAESAAGPGAETNIIAVVVTNQPAAITTNVTVSLANNSSGTVAPNQRTSNQQQIRTSNNQLTTRSNNLQVSLLTNIVIAAETNQSVAFVTNHVVQAMTNVIVTPTNVLAYEYFLYTELIPPADFSLASGESLILLVDGARYGFTVAPSATAFVTRRGYTSNLYRATPDALVAIANAKEVKVRFKGVNNVVERTMSSGSRQNFRKFVMKYFAPSEPALTPESVAALDTITQNANH